MNSITTAQLVQNIYAAGGEISLSLYLRGPNTTGDGLHIACWQEELAEGNEIEYERIRAFTVLLSTDSEGHIWITVPESRRRFSLTEPEDNGLLPYSRNLGYIKRQLDEEFLSKVASAE